MICHPTNHSRTAVDEAWQEAMGLGSSSRPPPTGRFRTAATGLKDYETRHGKFGCAGGPAAGRKCKKEAGISAYETPTP